MICQESTEKVLDMGDKLVCHLLEVTPTATLSAFYQQDHYW
jgi:hypothetical protein